VKTRIGKLRKALDLTKKDFAKRIGLTKNFISLIETGDRTPSERTLLTICHEFNVNETWLRTGEGEMFAPVRDDQVISRFLGDLVKEPESSFKRRLISTLSQLDETEWTTLEKIFDKIANNKSVAGQNCPGKGGPAV
jgi:transcriptional regulator with XRE-family HTH domain